MKTLIDYLVEITIGAIIGVAVAVFILILYPAIVVSLL